MDQDDKKVASGFTANYDLQGQRVGRETRMDELARLLAGSFGFAGKEEDSPQKLKSAAPTWFESFLDELETPDEFLSKYAQTNVGQWWEQVGGPHLAKGGSHERFQHMMQEAELSPGLQAKFMRVAKAKYPENYSTQEATPNAHAYAGAPGDWDAPEHNPKQPLGMSNTVGGFTALGLGGYMMMAPRKADAHAAPQRWKGRLGAHMALGLPLAAVGGNLGHLIGGVPGAVGGALLGGGAGALLTEKTFPGEEKHVQRSDLSKSEQQGLLHDAGRSSASLGRDMMLAHSILPAVLHSRFAGMNSGLGASAASTMGASLGSGMSQRYLSLLAAPKIRERQAAAKAEAEMPKAAASAPTRGNFMMASDLPAYRQPRLDQALQKNSDGLPDGVTANSSDFKRSKYAMSTSALGDYVAELLEKDAVALGAGTSPMTASAAAKNVGIPGGSLPTLPGPSIAQVAKPRGSGFGTGIAGAFKGTTSGTAPVDLGTSPGIK